MLGLVEGGDLFMIYGAESAETGIGIAPPNRGNPSSPNCHIKDFRKAGVAFLNPSGDLDEP